jgi:hypothetical protein
LARNYIWSIEPDGIGEETVRTPLRFTRLNAYGETGRMRGVAQERENEYGRFASSSIDLRAGRPGDY